MMQAFKWSAIRQTSSCGRRSSQIAYWPCIPVMTTIRLRAGRSPECLKRQTLANVASSKPLFPCKAETDKEDLKTHAQIATPAMLLAQTQSPSRPK